MLTARSSRLAALTNQTSENPRLPNAVGQETSDMIKNYFKIAWRNLVRSKGYSAINIGGLAVGMAVAMLIGLWVYDELTFNKYHTNYDRIAQVMQHATFNGKVETQTANPL
jgi:tRNA(His) 5'-end guanylyltransferase